MFTAREAPAGPLRNGDTLPRSVMLVRVERDEEPADFTATDPGLRVLRVKHPLPACVRMGVMRPLVIVVGPAVRDRDRAILLRTANELDSLLVDLGRLRVESSVSAWLQRTMTAVQARRERKALRKQHG
jgi:hypothetical protein